MSGAGGPAALRPGLARQLVIALVVARVIGLALLRVLERVARALARLGVIAPVLPCTHRVYP